MASTSTWTSTLNGWGIGILLRVMCRGDVERASDAGMDGDDDAVLAAACGRPSWYLADEWVTDWASSSANAARSAAVAKRTSPSSAKVATRCGPWLHPPESVPTSRTSRAAERHQPGRRRGRGNETGPARASASAAGEMTYDAAVARMTRSVTLPLRRSSTSSMRP